MKYRCSLTVVVLLREIMAFAPSLSAPSRPLTLISLTSEEILERARNQVGVMEEEQIQIFEPTIKHDMASALIKLEQRVKEGPGSLSMLEVEELTAELNRIVQEMKTNPDKRIEKTVVEELRAPQPAPSLSSSAQKQVEVTPLPSSLSPVAEVDVTSIDSFANSDEEGGEYDGSGGMGQPRGTVNTYIIEGMDEMNSEEYRLALQQSIIDRQRQRRKAGQVGAQGSVDYLSNLGRKTSDDDE